MEDLIDMLFDSLKKQKFSEYVDEHSEAVRRFAESHSDKNLQKVTPAEKTLGVRDIVDTCCICVEEFEPQTVLVQPPCGHVFHVDCLRSWVEARLQSNIQ